MTLHLFYFLKNFFLTIFSLVQVTFKSRWFIKFPKAHEKEIIVLGNGPSLNANLERDYNILLRNTLMCVNGFALSPYYEKLKPRYYVLADPAFWSETLPEERQKFINNTIQTISQKTTWPIILFLPFEGYNIFNKKSFFKNNPFILLQPYNDVPLRGFTFLIHKLLQLKLGVITKQNVILVCLILSINLEFKRIILLGADHSWHKNLHVTDDNRVVIIDEHFYHNEPNYIPLMINNRPSKLFEQFEALVKTFQAYWKIKSYAQERNAEIINASEVSYIDAFERRKLNKLF